MSTPCEYTLVEKRSSSCSPRSTAQARAMPDKAGCRYHPAQPACALPRASAQRGVLYAAAGRRPGPHQRHPRERGQNRSRPSFRASATASGGWRFCVATTPKRVEGEDTHRTIKVVDFDTPSNNHFAVTNQAQVQRGSKIRGHIPDLIIYLNGIPVVVIVGQKARSRRSRTRGRR